MIKVAVIFGTRPEMIKLVSVIKAFAAEKMVRLDVCFTGQHKQMVLPLLNFFGIHTNHSLDIMKPNQTLAALTSNAVAAIDKYLEEVQPDIVFVQGDTTSAMCAAIAAFYRRIKIAHVEAGLRTHQIFSPYPEEFNRQVISRIADLHFAPTKTAQDNLIAEGVKIEHVIVTGNTVIDALLLTNGKLQNSGNQIFANEEWYNKEKKLVLITGHRRENFGAGFENICSAIKELALTYQDINFVYPVHLNPNVQQPVKRLLSGLSNVFLIPPMDYVQFISLMNESYFILTDSGGVQEEAPSLHKPVLVMRDTTERMEAVNAGAAILVGTETRDIVQNASSLINDQELFHKMSNAGNPFGDGNAAAKIIQETLLYFS